MTDNLYGGVEGDRVKREFYYLSQDQTTNIHAIEWIPDGEVKAVLQICHGMVEYIDRYDEFARFMASKGYYVVGHDHLGHGQSVGKEEDHGYFHEKKGNEYVIGDIRELRRRSAESYKGCPYFILGHSMGSFLVRQYIQSDARGLAGVILMGTGNQPYPLVLLGKTLCIIIKVLKGSRYRSKLLNNMALGSYNKHFEPSRTPVDWISKDEAIVDQYCRDPWCTFVFTVNGYYSLFTAMQSLTRKNMRKVPKSLPLFFVSGEEDPVGGFGKGVEKVYQNYKTSGIKDITCKLYKEDRHEILNEIDRHQVYEDLYKWAETKRTLV